MLKNTFAKKPLRTLLIVDDSIVDRELIKAQLNNDDYGYVEAESPDDGVKKYIETEPDCVIVDFHLLNGDAIDFVDSLSLMRPNHAPIILISGQMDAEIRNKSSKEGIVCAFDKNSLSPRLFRQSVSTLLEKKDHSES